MYSNSHTNISVIRVFSTLAGSITHPLQASVRNATACVSGILPRDNEGDIPPPHSTTQQLILAVRNWLTVLYIEVGVANPPIPSVRITNPNCKLYQKLVTNYYYNNNYATFHSPSW